MLFGWSGKFYFPEIEIRWPKKKAFDHGNAFTLLFSLQSISEKWEREKERARARERRRSSQFDDRRQTPSSSPRGSRELQSDDREDGASSSSSPRSRSTARSREGKIAIALSIVISDRDQRRGHRTRNIFVVDDFFLTVVACFSGFVFSFFFSKHQKIFSGKFFEMQPNTWKHFPFPEISISGKYVFSEKHFTATKHSPRVSRFPKFRTF